MLKHKLSTWRFIIVLWPLLVVFIVAQWVMRMFGNSASIAIPWWLSLTDLTVFITVFTGAAVWVYGPLKRAQSWLDNPKRRTQRYLEQGISLLPKRAFKGFFIAGLCCAVYLIVVLNIGAAVSESRLTASMSIALALSLFYGAGVLAPSMALSMTLAYSVRLRDELASKGLFLHTL
ncbi:MAG: hypothetical protein Q9M21_06535, partial [Mariprofundaceae bacterium]|nr:hypothetical protein [Mariprofundaceae bacterium]